MFDVIPTSPTVVVIFPFLACMPFSIAGGTPPPCFLVVPPLLPPPSSNLILSVSALIVAAVESYRVLLWLWMFYH